MDSLSIVKMFNRQLESFVDELIGMFPEDSDFRLFKTSISLLTKTAPRKIVEIFQEFVITPYRDLLLSRDEQKILNMDFKHLEGDVDMDIVPKLKQYWNSMSDSSKDAIWKYCDVLIKLSDKYHEGVARTR